MKNTGDYDLQNELIVVVILCKSLSANVQLVQAEILKHQHLRWFISSRKLKLKLRLKRLIVSVCMVMHCGVVCRSDFDSVQKVATAYGGVACRSDLQLSCTDQVQNPNLSEVKRTRGFSCVKNIEQNENEIDTARTCLKEVKGEDKFGCDDCANTE